MFYKHCKTNGGGSPDSKCIFPFIWGDTKYEVCALSSVGYSCATKVDSSGNFINGYDTWGTCGQHCPFPGRFIVSYLYRYRFM